MRQAGGRVQGAESILRPAPTTANERPERLEHRADGRQSTGTQEDLSITTALTRAGRCELFGITRLLS